MNAQPNYYLNHMHSKYLTYHFYANYLNHITLFHTIMHVLMSISQLYNIFLKNGANIEAEDEEKETPLHTACYKSIVSFAQYLIKKS